MLQANSDILQYPMIDLYLYHVTSVLMYVIGQKVWIILGHNHTFCFCELLRIQNRACLGGISWID